MIVAGVGFRRSVAADEIVALVELALERASLARDALGRLATIAALAETPAFKEAARRLDVTAMPVDRGRPRRSGAARAHAIRALPRGAWSRLGRGSGGACGRRASTPSLILERIASASATCALARLETGP